MMELNGPGKYDEEVRLVQKATDAALVLLVVVGGDRGTGFSVAAIDPKFVQNVPDVLDVVSAKIREQVNAS
jgi:hypothetical protein